jgi:hemerythrin-like metal-binding protein
MRSTGLEALDHEHLQLIEAINDTCAGIESAEGTEPVLDALGLLYMRTCAHFALEQKLARERSPELNMINKLKYEALLDRLRTMMDSYEDGRCEMCDRSLGDCLMSWMGKHLRTAHRDPGPGLSAFAPPPPR